MTKVDDLTADQININDIIRIEGDRVSVTTDPQDNGDSIYFWGWNYSTNDSEEFILFPDEMVELLLP